MSWPVRAAVLAMSVCVLPAIADGLPFEVSMEVLDSIEGVDGVVLVLEPVEDEPAGHAAPAAGGGESAATAPARATPARAAPAQEDPSQPE